MALVQWGSRLVPRGIFTPPLDLAEGVCVLCGGLGVVPEQIDEDRFEVAVPCPHCEARERRART